AFGKAAGTARTRAIVVEASEVPPGTSDSPVGATPAIETATTPVAPTASGPTAAPANPPAANKKASPKENVSSVTIHYATNRNRLTTRDRQFMEYFLGFFSSTPAFVVYAILILSQLLLPWFGKRSWALGTFVGGLVVLVCMGAVEAQIRSKLRDEMTG